VDLPQSAVHQRTNYGQTMDNHLIYPFPFTDFVPVNAAKSGDIHDKLCQGGTEDSPLPTADVVTPDLRAGAAIFFAP
jgi:hypothetical protein